MIRINIKRAGYILNESIISNVQFTLKEQEIVGLIGGNGAGKSTTIQSMLGTIAFFEGEVKAPTYGYVPERPILYTYYTLREHIDFLGQVLEQDIWHSALELCTLFRLNNHLDEYPINFSKGMQQKVMLVLAFAPNYQFYILDEPFMGLDPQAIRRLLLLIREKKVLGATFLICTHALDTAEKLCDRFLCMHEGQLIAQGTLKELSNDNNDSLLDVFDALIEGDYYV